MSIATGTIFRVLQRDGVLTPGGVLDLGCGNGIDAITLSENNFIVDAVDVNEEVLKALPASPSITPIHSKIEDFEIPKNTYNLVSCQLVLHFLSKEAATKVIHSMIDGAVQGGVIAFNLLSSNDDWKNMCSTWTREEVDALVQTLPVAVHKIMTEEGNGRLVTGDMKYWHLLSYILIKK